MTATCSGLCGPAAGAGAATSAPSTPARAGVVVESLDAGSALAAAGIAAGDLLLQWERAGGGSAGEGARGDFASPSDVLLVEREQAPRGELRVEVSSPCASDGGGGSGGGDCERRLRWVVVPPGEWGLAAGPPLPDYDLAAPEGVPIDAVALAAARGAALRQQGDSVAAEAAYREAVALAEGGLQAPLLVAWLHLLVAESAHDRRDLAAMVEPLAAAQALVEREAPRSLVMARTLNAHANVAWRRDDFAGAKQLLERALTLAEALAPRGPIMAQTLDRLGILAEESGELDAAGGLYQRALALREALAPDSLEVASTLNNLGLLARLRGDFDGAVAYFERALAIREKLAPGGMAPALTLYNLGLIARHRGELAKAAELYQRAHDMFAANAPESNEVAMAISGLGLVAHERGDLEAAAAHYRRAQAIVEKVAPGSLELARTFDNQGLVARDRGDLEEAEELMRRALAIREARAPDGSDVAYGLSNLGALACDRFDWDRAQELFRRALVIRERVAPHSVALTLNNLGFVAWSRGDLEAADGLFARALALRAEMVPGSPQHARSLNSLGMVALARGEHARAGELHRQALAIQQPLAPGSLEVAQTLGHLGRLAVAAGDLAAAAERYRESLAIQQALAPASQAVAATLHELAAVRRAQGDLRGALDGHLQSVAVLEQQSRRLGGSQEVKAQFAAGHAEHYRKAIAAAVALGESATALHLVERSRARGLLELLAERELVFAADVPAALEAERREADRDYQRTQAQLDALDASRDKEEVQRLQTRLREVRERQAEVARRVREASPRYAALRYPQPLDLAGIRAALDPGTVLLAYSVGEGESFLFAVAAGERGGVAVFPLAVGEAALREAVEGFRTLISRRAVGEEAQRVLEGAGGELFARLVAPAEHLLAGAERVVIVPDGPLHALPFAALSRPGGGGDPFLAWKPLHTVVSTTVYAELQRDRAGPPPRGSAPRGSAPTGGAPTGGATTDSARLVAFGDPRYPAAGTTAAYAPALRSLLARGQGTLTPLPASRLEVERLARLYGAEATTFLGDEATEERAKEQSPRARILHFATHGLLDERFPLDSALVLSLPERRDDERAAEAEDGLLQAWEIFERLRLHADLVTLSACDTALGRESGGEGLLGLTRAFQYAGARSILASLWSVDDTSTGELMGRFYGHLRAGRSKDEALRQAQLELWRDPDTAHAFHWAAFTLIGDWR